jgi:hypothetical protein
MSPNGLTLLVAQDAEKATMDRQPGFTAVIDETQLPEPIHEQVDPRPGRSDHLRQVFLIDAGHDCFGPAVLPKVRQQQEHPSQALLAGVEHLVDEIRFVSDEAGKQMPGKCLRESRFFVEHSCHRRLLDLGQRTISHGSRRDYAQRLTGEASFTEELTGAQSGDNRFPAIVRGHREPHLASQEKVHGIRRLSLHEDGVVVTVFQLGLAPGALSQEG